jgi:AcrR family transcriptional regulator
VAGTSKRGDSARAALIETAERLFAQRGIEAVSLRDVSAAAGQRNHSAAQYHFGDRRGLVAAVYQARMEMVDERRRSYLDALDKTVAPDRRALVEAIVLPLLDVVTTADGWYARFLARTRWDPFAWDVLVSTPASAGVQQVLAALDQSLAELTPMLRRHRLDALLTLVIGMLAGWEGAPDRGDSRLDPTILAAELVGAALAVLTPTLIGVPA